MRKLFNTAAATMTAFGFGLFISTLVWGLVAFWHPLPQIVGWVGVFGGFALMVLSPLLYKPERLSSVHLRRRPQDTPR